MCVRVPGVYVRPRARLGEAGRSPCGGALAVTGGMRLRGGVHRLPSAAPRAIPPELPSGLRGGLPFPFSMEVQWERRAVTWG